MELRLRYLDLELKTQKLGRPQQKIKFALSDCVLILIMWKAVKGNMSKL